MTIRKSWIVFGTMLGAMLFSFASVPAQAQTTLPATIIDDFNDGDSSDWGFFGGNAAGGGGGAEADRPQEGTHYLSTGWGGQGTASGFYGGGFKNFDNAGQVVLPADAWFNVWVYNQSDATSDGYTLEITLREDTDGNGWTDTAEDSFRLDATFTSADYNDEWTLISAPVSSFANLNTGGDGTFNGNLDEIVIVIAGVTGGDPSTVEADLDQFSFTSGGPIVSPEPTVTVIDDFNDGDSSDWGFFGGNAAGGGGGAEADRPQEGTHYLSTGWGGQGTASGFYGGGFKNFDNAGQVVLPADAWFNVWVYNQSDATSDGYTLEITLREDTDGNGWTDTAEDSFRLDTAFTSADYNDEWTLISAPVSSFANLNTGGDGTFDGNLDEIVIVIASVTGGDPSTVELDFDQFSFTSGGPIVDPEPPEPIVTVIDDFNDGDSADWGFFGGNAAGGGGGAEADRPQEGTHYLSTGWGGQGTTSGFYGGGFKNFDNAGQVVLPADAWFNVWVYNQSDATSDGYTLEITLREDTDGNGWTDTAEDSFRLDTTFTSADYNDEWTLISAPVSSFANLNTGGDGTFNGNLDEVVIVIAGVTGGDPSTVELDFDQFSFTSGGPIVTPEPPAPTQIVDDFENGLPTGVIADTDPAVPIGFFTFSDGSPVSIAITNTLPALVPDSAAGNNVMALTGDVTAFAGFIHGFENDAVDAWVPQDWSGFGGFRFWLYGYNNGTTVFVDVIDNRNPDSTSDDAERFTVSLVDNFEGWQQFEFPFADFERKEIGNGAPNDGFTLTQVHGWALGTLDTDGEVTYFIDDAELYGEAVIPDLAVTFVGGRYDIEEGTTGEITVKLNRALNSDDPAQVSVDYATFPGVAIPGREYTPVSGTLVFENGGPSELTFSIETFDDTKWEGDERIGLSLTNPVDVATGFATLASAFIVENDTLDPNLVDDFSYGPYMWEGDGVVETKEIEAGDADAIPGQDAFETVLNFAPSGSASPQDTIVQVALDLETLLPANTNFLSANIINAIYNVNQSADSANWEDGYFLDSNRGFKVFDGSAKAVQALQRVVKNRRASAELKASAQDAIDTLLGANVVVAYLALDLANENDGNSKSIASAERYKKQADRSASRGNIPTAMNKYGWMWVHATRAIKNIDVDLPQLGQASISREFPDAEDWSAAESMSFWYYGQNSGDAVTVELLDNRAADPGPSGWEMVWAEEFNEPAGTTPNPEYWTYEIGDVTPDGKNGWGNDERQYYTDDAANAATDGDGNMVLTVREDTSGRDCYYGECEYTSARLISWRKAEFAYGRIESRIKVPEGEGIWPAFWSLGTDIDVVSWPQTGEIDFMEFVGRLPNEIFGTIHGPGYAGGASFGNVYDFGEPVYNDYHTFAVEWEPDLIKWYVDGILYHTATPDDVAPNEWVFNDEVFLLLNVAIGGNFGGAIDPNIPLPASMAVDYIRVYQGPDTAERFETTFTDDFSGWQEVTVPFDGFARSAEQPAGAPDDGLTLTGVRGLGFKVPTGDGSAVMIDQIHLDPIPLPSEVVVTTLADSGPGSLREAIAGTATDGTITFDPALAGGTITLTSGQLVIDRSVTIDGSGAVGLTVSGNNASRVFTVNAPATVSMNDLTVSDGVGSPQGGGILNGGVLNLDAMVITNNTESSAGPADFQFGGGGIYNGEGATLNLTNSTVSNNSTLNQPGGGIYGFFSSTINVTNSTISGNVSGDVAGGFRTLGDVTVVNSTISGNVSTGWHGGGMFSTDGTVVILNSTITGNSGPDGTAGGLMIASFGNPVNATIQNSIIADNGSYGCQIEGGSASLSSLGNNVSTDPSCALDASDLDVGTNGAGLGTLANNGGPTLTHALEAGSPAIDAANGAVCPATDQRGVARPQGAGCDIGAVEAN